MMFALTNDQKYIADILDETGYMRIDQAHRLLRLTDPEKDNAYAKRILSQLQTINRACWLNDETVSLLNLRAGGIDDKMLSAVDIMLDLLSEPPLAVSSKKPPFKLSFLARREDDILAYAVGAITPGGEREFNFYLKDMEDDIVIVFLLSDVGKSKLISTSLTHFFAVYDDEKLRYYKGESD